MIDQKIFEKLNKTLKRSWLVNGWANSSSVAVTQGSAYFSGYFESQTHLLDISSEQGAIVLAVSNKDPKIEKIITLVEKKFESSPLIVKFFIDHISRTGRNFSYRIINKQKETLFFSEDMRKLMPLYNPKEAILEKIENWKPRENKMSYNSSAPIYGQLKEAAKKGMETHFTKTSKGSLYGASVLAGDNIYFGGGYSCPDQRLGLHAEMVAALGAIMDGNREISWVGLISNKFIQRPSRVCGCCRQFLIELQQKTKIPIKIACFSYEGDNRTETNLSVCLPDFWSSLKKTHNSL